MESFAIQTPEWYESIYSSKDYSSESDYFLRVYNTYNSSLPCILDVGSGTGSLIPLLKPFSSNYIALEPYIKFNDHLKLKFLREKNIQIEKQNFQDYVKNCNTNIKLIVANFNVINYIPYLDFVNACKTLANRLNKGTIIIFDTWSLDFVREQP